MKIDIYVVFHWVLNALLVLAAVSMFILSFTMDTFAHRLLLLVSGAGFGFAGAVFIMNDLSRRKSS